VLQDIKELQLTANPAYNKDASKAGSDVLVSPYICPVTGLEMNGRYKWAVHPFSREYMKHCYVGWLLRYASCCCAGFQAVVDRQPSFSSCRPLRSGMHCLTVSSYHHLSTRSGVNYKTLCSSVLSVITSVDRVLFCDALIDREQIASDKLITCKQLHTILWKNSDYLNELWHQRASIIGTKEATAEILLLIDDVPH